MTTKKLSKKQRIENGELTLICTKCKQEKKVNDFYENFSHCKECHREQVSELEEQKHLKFLVDCVEQGIITNQEIPAARLLLDSCKSRFRACKYDWKGYEKVKCDYDSYFAFFMDLVVWKEFFVDWKKQALIYEQNNRENNARPTIDRINELGDYTLDNIQCLSKRENVLKAQQIASKAILFKGNGQCIGKFEFSSKSHFTECLSKFVPASVIKTIKYDTFQPQQISDDTYILLQSENANTYDTYKIGSEHYLWLVNKRYYVDKKTFKIAKVDILDVERFEISHFEIQ